MRKMMAVLLSMTAFKTDIKEKVVQVLTDNILTVVNINFQGGQSADSEEQVISMLEFLIDNIFVSFQQVVGIPMGTNCAPFLADLFVYSYESEFLQKLVKDKKMHEARAFNFTYRYIDDVLSINNSRFAEFLPLIYPPELEIKETTDTASSASFLDLYLEFDDSGQISTKIYDKRDDFNFKIINFPNMCSNIPASPAYGVYISQLIRYARASSNYSDILKRHLHLRNRLLDQGYKKIRLIRSLKKVYIPIPRSCRNIFRLCRKDYKRWIFI